MIEAVRHWQRYSSGLGVAAVIAMAATFLSMRYGAPAMLMGLLLGLVFHFLTDNEAVMPGIELAASGVLRLGVALLGLRISLDDVLNLGLISVAAVCAAVILTLLFGMGLAHLMGLSKRLGTLTGGAVAICGASAAMAISSVLPQNPNQRKETLFTVIGVTTLSTMAMVVYPLVSHWLGLTEQEAGLFLGATIHDVAQVVGAGYSVSTEAGDLGTFVKLVRVAMLVPIVLVIGMVASRYGQGAAAHGPRPAVPWFLVLFVALFALNSSGVLPVAWADAAAGAASWLLLIAISALGVRTSLKEITDVGLRPVLLMVSETVFIAVLILLFIAVR